MQLPKLIFHVQWGDRKSVPVEIEIRNQPLAHEQKRIMDAIGKALSEMRKRGKPAPSVV